MSKTSFFLPILLCLVLLSFKSSFGQETSFNRAKMDSLFYLIDKNSQAMGSLSIFQDGKETYQHTFGSADAEQGIPANASTKYRIGSISKTFTAAIILQLVDERKLELNTNLSDFFPEVPNSSKITVEQLLRHRSGLFNFTSSPDYTSWMEQATSMEEMLDRFAKQQPVFSPGEKSAYSNTNYVLLSMIAEKIEEKSFAQILQDRISKPNSLINTHYGEKIKPEQNEAFSYNPSTPWTKATETDLSVPRGAGAIVSTPTDLNRFYHALFSGKVVSENSLEQMKTPLEGFGLGLFPIPFYDKVALGHNGGIDGFQSNAAYFEKDNVGIAFVSNGLVMPMNDILIGVLSIYFDKPYTLPTFTKPLDLNSEDLDVYLGTYSSPDFPLKVTISKQGNTLIGQATGQSSFPLVAKDVHVFTFTQAQLTLEFEPEENKMTLLQGPGKYVLTREE